MQNKKVNILFAWITVITVLFVMLFSMIFISQHANHTCNDSDCAVCAIMDQCVNNIKTVGINLIIVAVSIFLCLSTMDNVGGRKADNVSISLISQKVRMNN